MRWSIRSAFGLLKVFKEFLVFTSKLFSRRDLLKHEKSPFGLIHFSRKKIYHSVYTYKWIKKMTLKIQRFITFLSEDV